ncbi:YchJ family protein [Macromonas nakdongensis]|uniref:YchJ family protein n=1 Tax=Macromonas nakdongensis TaxID=1843082 RepID=UPI000C348DC0|nr:YchJ family metal-binding protein [Macromonas nakdongensis]
MATDPLCPCGRQVGGRPLAWSACCGRHVDAFERCPAPDAEALMRSRYSAFVHGQADYLLATWHPSTRPATLELEPGVKWLGLEVRRHRRLDETRAEVEFVARSRLAGRGQRLHETSRFVQEDGRWYYVDGDLSP